MLSAPRLSEADWTRFRELLLELVGIDIPDARRADIDRAVAHAIEVCDLRDNDALYARLKDPVRGRQAFDAMMPLVTVGETHFFRNRPQFEALENDILPSLIQSRRDTKRLRVWSAACSSGEEPYSLAILLDRLIPDRADWSITILATDINPKAFEKARRGLYGSWSFREVPADIKSAYFTARDQNRFELDPRIRQMVTFRELNLVEDAFPSTETNTNDIDLLVCRNVLIYFREHTIREIVNRFHRSVVDGGWLVVGHAEPSQETFAQFAARNFPGTVVYQKTAKLQAQPRPVPQPAAAPARPAFEPRRPIAPARSKPPVAAPAARPKPAPVVRPPAAAPVARGGSCDEALALARAGRKDDAIRLLEGLAKDQKEDGRAAYLLAKVYAGKMLFPEAERWVKVALERGTAAPAPAHYLHGLVLQEQRRDSEAVEAFRRCVYADAEFALGHFALAGSFGRTGQGSRAHKELDYVTSLLERRRREEALPEGDGLRVGDLLDLVAAQRKLVA